MSNSYQAIYDAVRSRISGGNVGQAIEEVLRQADISHYASQARDAIQIAAAQYERPSVIYRPSMGFDGNKWCVLYGSNLMEGVAGFGDTPAEAMADFDKNWCSQKPPSVFEKCPRCSGTGAIDAPYSGSDPSCPDCDGTGRAAEGEAG